MVTFGVDAHKRTHTIVAVNDRGTPVGQTTVGTTSQDHLVLLRWAARFGGEPMGGGGLQSPVSPARARSIGGR